MQFHSDEFLQMLREHDFVPEAEDVTAAMKDALRKDVQALAIRGSAGERAAAIQNLLQAANDETFSCLMITAHKKTSRE